MNASASGIRRSLPVLILASLLPALIAPGSFSIQAQEPDLGVRISPSAGMFFPADQLYRSDLPPARAEMNRAAGVGLGVQVLSQAFPLSLRVQVQRVDWFDTVVEGRQLGSEPDAGFAAEETHRFAVPTALTFFTGDLILRSPVELAGLRPYAFAGLGFKNYDFGEEEPRDEIGFTFPVGGTSGMIHYGAGAELTVFGRSISSELAGSFSRFVLVDDATDASRAHPQHEFIFSVKVHFDVLDSGL